MYDAWAKDGPLPERVEREVERWLAIQRDRMQCVGLASCESPAEQLLFMGFLNAGASIVDGNLLPDSVAVAQRFGIDDIPTLWFWHGRAVLLVQLGLALDDRNVRLDFAVVGDGKRVAVEVDGHDWHERTKEQAERDKSRDRLLQAAGWQVFRFTGSEVWRAPDRCAQEVLKLWENKTEGW